MASEKFAPGFALQLFKFCLLLHRISSHGHKEEKAAFRMCLMRFQDDAAGARSNSCRVHISIQTLNNFGCQYNYSDEYVKDFIEYAGKADGTIADLGCGYGASSKRMLDAGARKIIANDLSSEQLDIFYNSLNEKEKERVEFIPGNALELEGKIEVESLAGIIAANWLNFLRPEGVQQAMKVFWNSLRPEGKLCILTFSCYSELMENAQDVVAHRKAAGETWPGLWTKALYSGPFATHLPDFIHCLDPDVLEREVNLVGFKVEKAGYIDFGLVFQGLKVDGREGAGLIAVKP